MGAVLSVTSFVFFLAILEFVTRALQPASYYVWPPNFRHTFRPEPGLIHGVGTPSELTINSFGMRGDVPPDEGRYRLLTIGGSTTICVYLDDAKAWPYLLQQRLRDALGPESVWVGNVGRPGHSTAEHVLQVDKLLQQPPEVDALVLLIGINDLLMSLSNTTGAPARVDPDPRAMLRRAFSVFPDWDEDSPWYLRNAVGRLIRLRGWHPMPFQKEGIYAMDEKGRFVEMLREYRRAAASFRPAPPDLSAALSGYTRNVNAIIDLAEKAGVRVIFLTQPTLWAPEMTRAERDLLWAGGPNFFHLKPGAKYYSAEALAGAMKTYNDALLEVCREREAECVDMASEFPRNTTVFYDDAHFTEAGSAMLAQRLAAYLMKHEPLNARSAERTPAPGDTRRAPGSARG
jgi:lysophospholipase L1-like esterase